MKLLNFVNSIIIPCYWVYSTKNNFKEFWSTETVFLKQLSPPAIVAPYEIMGKRRTSTVVLVPRRPERTETSFTNEGSLTVKSRLPGKFSYGF